MCLLEVKNKKVRIAIMQIAMLIFVASYYPGCEIGPYGHYNQNISVDLSIILNVISERGKFTEY